MRPSMRLGKPGGASQSSRTRSPLSLARLSFTHAHIVKIGEQICGVRGGKIYAGNCSPKPNDRAAYSGILGCPYVPAKEGGGADAWEVVPGVGGGARRLSLQMYM